MLALDETTAPRVALIGAGPCGLAAARNLRRRGIDYVQFERHSGVGGIWDIAQPGTPMYASAHFISSRDRSGYYGFPMPETYPDYPGHRLILAYTQAFASAFDLVDGIRFDTPVSGIAPAPDGGWDVSAGGRTETFSHVVCATGHTWSPQWPSFPGTFDGEVMHSVDFEDGERFRGRRVLVVGAGNSACDIACEAARNADAAYISMRRGYHFIPKHILGQPTDVFAARSKWMPAPMRRAFFERLLQHLQGDLTRYGLPAPDHRVLASHPIINTQLIHHLQHGDIHVHANIERLDGSEVVFVDGRRVEVDLIVYATGYRYDIPYADAALFDWNGSKPRLDYAVFNRRHERLFAVGFTEMNAGGYYIFDEMTSLVADAIATQSARPDAWRAARAAIEAPVDFSGGLGFVASDRHTDYLDMDTYLAACGRLCRRLGWSNARTLLS